MVLTLSLRSFRWPEETTEALREVHLQARPGQILAVTGSSGSGKSTLGRILAGQLPGEEGLLEGSIELAGQRITSTAEHPPRIDRADWGAHVAFVPQHPREYLSAARSTVAEEIAFGPEQRGIPRVQQRRAVADRLAAFGLTELAGRDPLRLSGGQQRRVALAAATVLHPPVLVLDEPTAGLDAAARERVCADIFEAARAGTAVILLAGEGEVAAELAHERIELPDPAPGTAPDGTTRPTADDAARQLPRPAGAGPTEDPGRRPADDHAAEAAPWAAPGPLTIRGLSVLPADAPTRRRRTRRARRGPADPPVRELDLTIPAGACTALTGPNGAGKTTLLRGILGLGRIRGTVTLGPHTLPADPRLAAEHAALLFQDAEDLFTERTAQRQVEIFARVPERVPQVLERCGLTGVRERHPLELPGAGRRLLGIACALARDTPVLLLDEPTVGMDAAGRRILLRLLRERAAAGGIVLVSTHDAELIAACSAPPVVLSAD
ncbi:ATP-binding cassette domain-containing protein [Rothia kristinae]|uniref:ATP-binding cassette domain-containing protein n=1 Tax=Rothia kristinae TaxID=37923 RepID=A0A7T4MVE3_9MICC|nr:ATP-binding cassette domain-containing protein [Rothia kristinae]QQC60321.1 ATP-binding cassette domain-containing protein [Rothia kristinae]